MPPAARNHLNLNNAKPAQSVQLGDTDPSSNTHPSSAIKDLDRVDMLLATLEQQVDRATRRTHAEQASRLAELGSLAAMFAHEVNNIMTQVGGRAQLALRSSELTASSIRAHELAAAASIQIARLAEFFMEAGVQADSPTCLLPEPTRHTPISIRTAHRQAMGYLPAEASSRYQYQLTFDPPLASQHDRTPAKPLQSVHDDLMVSCPLFEQVLLNCYRNAAQAMDRRPPFNTNLHANPGQNTTIEIRVTPGPGRSSDRSASWTVGDARGNCSTWNNSPGSSSGRRRSDSPNCSTWNNWEANAIQNTLWGPSEAMGADAETDSNAKSEAGPGMQRMVRIDILDTGVGMDVRQIDRVLKLSDADEPHDPAQEMLFGEQAEGLSRPAHTDPAEGGHGIGLQVCRRLIDRAGGRFEMRSTPGVGTMVSIWLPTR
ncbi:MAG: ATP-binding protein [Phycisphaerales bacterium]